MKPYGVLSFSLVAALGVFGVAISQVSRAAPRQEVSGTTYITKPTRLWTEPSKFGEPIAALDPGLEVKILSYTTTASWALVSTPAGREGWVPVRFTALSGRREKPVLGDGSPPPGEYPEAEDGKKSRPRKPASDGAVTIKAEPFSEKSEWSFTGDLSYQNLLSRDQISGLALGAGAEMHMSGALFVGFGLDFGYFRQSLTEPGVGQVKTSVKRLFPYAQARYAPSASWDVALALGADIDTTGYTSYDASGNLIPATPDGATTGSDTSFGLGVKFRPTFKMAMGESAALGFFLQYYMTVDFSGGDGRFVGPTTSSLAHTFGAGASYSVGF